MTVTDIYVVAAQANDGVWRSPSTFDATGPNIVLGKGSVEYNNFIRFTNVVIPLGSVISDVRLRLVYKLTAGTPRDCDLYFEKAANPSAITSVADGDSRVKTTTTVKIKATTSTAGVAWDSVDLTDLLNELVAAYPADFASGTALQVLIYPPTGLSIAQYTLNASWDDTTYDPPKLLITYGSAIVRNAASSRNESSNRVERFAPVVGTPIVLTTPTYDGSGQAVHPSVRYIPATFGGYKYWMGMTPYPNGNDDYENPSLVASNDVLAWVVPAGITNPIAPKPADHNCDSCIIFDGENLLYYYCKYEAPIDQLRQITVSEGPLTVGANAACTFSDSYTASIWAPAIVRNSASDWLLWFIDSSYNLRRYVSTDGTTWTDPTIISIFTTAGQRMQNTITPWHFSVEKIGDRYLFICCCYPYGGNSAQTDLYYAVADRWDSHLVFRTSPILTEFADWGSRQVYYSCLCQIENGTWRLFISAATDGGVWRIGYADIVLW